MTGPEAAPPLDHAAIAADFAAAMAAGREPRLAATQIRDHLRVLHALLDAHPLEACRRYAERDEIVWGAFKALDRLRLMVLLAPEAIDPALPETPVAEGVTLCPRPGATRALIVFTALRQQVGGSLRLSHRWLAQPDVSLIYLADTPWSFYLGTMPALGTTLAEKTDRLRGYLDDLGCRSCAAFGSSGGGFGALVFARGLGATRTLAYSPPSLVSRDNPHLAGVADLAPFLGPSGAVELAALLQRSPPPGPAKVYFPALNAHDAAEALRLDGAPGLSLHPVADETEHNLIPPMVARGLFQRHLRWLMAD